jgi:viroplasmin and RNaseH domain-containing protein
MLSGLHNTMTWYVVYRGRKPRAYAKWATCHQQVSGYPNCCYKWFSNKEDANASFLEFTGEAAVPVYFQQLQMVISKTKCLLILVVFEFLIIVGLLVLIIRK